MRSAGGDADRRDLDADYAGIDCATVQCSATKPCGACCAARYPEAAPP